MKSIYASSALALRYLIEVDMILPVVAKMANFGVKRASC